jgi:lipopolysaccharide/colanic/teichoic acid biosynthesis glycosyltransferase
MTKLVLIVFEVEMNRITRDVLTQVKPGQNVQFEEKINADIVWKPALSYTILKRCIDIVLAVLGIVALLPLFIFVAFYIKLEDGGPILHFREIVGFNGRHFHALKFRTMIVDADSYLQKRPELLRKFQHNMKLEQDPRVTNVGRILRKMSIDELPQLFNVVVGQMSLVGPRMIHPSELSRYGIYAEKRLSVKPGITGLWQISGRGCGSYKERIVLDMKYIDQRSLLLDILVLIKTLKVFVVHTGA